MGERENVRATVWIVLTLGGTAASLTLLYLGMRSVMDVGGFCAEGGPYVIRQECPDGVPAIMVGSIWGGLILGGLYVFQAFKRGIPGFAALLWPALFLSLGWNFLEYSFNPPGPGGGIVWGWLVCAVVFAAMGGLPLLALLPSLIRGFTGAAAPRPGWPGGVPVAPARRVAARVTGAPAGLVSELERLDGLRRSGALDEEEFRLAKERLLRGAS